MRSAAPAQHAARSGTGFGGKSEGARVMYYGLIRFWLQSVTTGTSGLSILSVQLSILGVVVVSLGYLCIGGLHYLNLQTSVIVLGRVIQCFQFFLSVVPVVMIPQAHPGPRSS